MSGTAGHPTGGPDLTHVDAHGKARMVDVSTKRPVRRTARARGKIHLTAETVARIRDNQIEKGDVLTVARIAGITGAKQTPQLIPLCHSLALDHADVQLTLQDDGVAIEGSATCTGPTGVEMEALTAVSIAALTVYDMCKAVDKSMRIGDIELVEKTKSEISADAPRQSAGPAADPSHPEEGT
ncbi:MAG: cyclic pyranopterin monophosphate synthase MoaC [bacterium]